MCDALQVLQDIRGTLDVEEEFNDICAACEVANKVLACLLLLLLPFPLPCPRGVTACSQHTTL